MTNAAMEKPRLMPFGKFKGQPLTEMKGNYLSFLLQQSYMRPPLKDWIEEELRRRGSMAQNPAATNVTLPRPKPTPQPALPKRARELVETGFRVLIGVGGDGDSLAESRTAREWLLKHVAAAQKAGA